MIRGFVGRRWLFACVVLVAGGLMVAPAAASADDAPLTVTTSPIGATEGQSFEAAVATVDDSDDTTAPTSFTATIDWGDGSSAPGAVVQTNGVWTVTGIHTYAEEGDYSVSVTVSDPADGASGSGTAFATVADAGLALPAGTPTQYFSLGSFEAAIGGSDNGTTAGEQNGGYRHITWDDVALNGTDPGSTTITPNHVVSVAPSREQARGILLGHGVAVANNGFTSVNPGVGPGTFPAFSSPNLFASYSSNRITMQIVNPAAQSSSTAPATTRGLGVMFMSVQQPDTTSIQYFSGSTLLYTAFAPSTDEGPGQPSFVGVLFQNPAITQVVINLGSAAIFNFDGTSVTAGSLDPTNLVAADDVVLAEPSNPQPTIQATAGVPVTSSFGTFSDTDPNGTPSDYSAVVNWGDGSASGAPISGSGGTLSVTGTHAYLRQGTFQVTSTVTDFGGSAQTSHVTIQVAPRSSATSVSCSPSKVLVGSPTTCTATVTDVGGGFPITPTGSVGFGSSSAGVGFSSDTGCGLKATSTPGKSSCSIVVTPGHYPPRKADVLANYNGDGAHSASSGSASVRVKTPTCTVKLLSKRVSPQAKRLNLRVTCKVDAKLTITVRATPAGQKQIKFAHIKTTAKANKHTTIHAVFYSSGKHLLRTAKKGLRLTLKVTVVATPRTKTETVHLTSKGVKVT